ncbi:uncharacterized protein J4E88_004476 [Alternaria novae-zelandiae]|uniref:uncharacterized protein n=1 Tax=Alternaria novae-zelandiae TaxID=430562 RepID=UPI0020C37D13|nr:uncharacterized protein J4E88_004476 [Alternaria novae-zelandiae]KAI4685033.1 hypothetical protein J4E88_004476 [Alternaria novae-zelandiae]
MAPAEPSTDKHAVGDQTEADAVSVISDDEDIGEDARKDVPLLPEVKRGPEDEPFETLKHKASQLILDLFPGYCPRDVKIERMQDGENNRFLSVTLCKVPPKAPWYTTQRILELLQPCLTGRPTRQNKRKRLVLRIPHNPDQCMHHQSVVLAYLGLKLENLVPKIVTFDPTAHNALGRSYMLQKRLPGQRLDALWPTLNQAQRLSAVRAISAILLHVRKIRNKCPGLIGIRNTTYALKNDFVSTEPIPIPRFRNTTNEVNWNVALSEPQSTKDFLLDLCARQRAHATAAKQPGGKEVWVRIVKVIETLHESGLIPDSSPFHFYHGDFNARNLLASVTSESEIAITGIVGWDSALFAPAFMSTRAPFFLWSGNMGSEGEEGGALVEPKEADLLEAKRAFESLVGDSFLKEAYSPALILARRLWRFLVSGFTNGADIFLAEEIVEEFERLHSSA